MFPRLKPFNFEIEKDYKIPVHHVGRLDLISYELYGNVQMSKPIAAANNIKIPYITRMGIRPDSESIRNEFILKGYTGSELENQIENALSKKQHYSTNWNAYGDVFNGYVSSIYLDRVLLIPSFASASAWLKQYEYIVV